MIIRILGRVEHHQPGRVISLRGKAAALLTTLALQANRTVPLDVLTEVLWDGDPPRSAVANLRTYVHALRDSLSGEVRVEGHDGGYLLALGPGDGDHLRFAELVAQAKSTGSPARAVKLLEAALELWQGESAAQQVPRHGPLAAWLEAVEEERMRAVESLAEARIALGEAGLAARELSILLTRCPLRDRAWWLSMRAHHDLGEYGEMVASYQAASRLFRTELGMAPSSQLTDLYRTLVLGGIGHNRFVARASSRE